MINDDRDARKPRKPRTGGRRIWVTVFLLCVLIGVPRSASQGDQWNRIELHSPSQCAYRGISYLVSSDLDVTLYDIFEEKPPFIYDLGDLVPSAFETTAIREMVVKELNRRRLTRLQLDMEKYPLTSRDLLLEAEYHFPNSPDFVLLRYTSAAWFPRHFFVGYARSSERIYFLSYRIRRHEPDSTTVVFNQMLAENPGLVKESPLCIAYILLALREYPFSTPMIVLDSYDDLNRSVSILESWSTEPTPEYLLTFSDLYFTGVSKDETLARYGKWTHEHDSIFTLLDNFGYRDSVAVSGPTVVTQHDTTVIVLTTCGRAGDDLATYRITLLGQSKVLGLVPITNQFDGPVRQSLQILGDCFYRNIRTWGAECDSLPDGSLR